MSARWLSIALHSGEWRERGRGITMIVGRRTCNVCIIKVTHNREPRHNCAIEVVTAWSCYRTSFNIGRLLNLPLRYHKYLTIIELTMWPCVWQPTPTTVDVIVTKIACYVRVRILTNRCICSRIFGIHSFYATATLLNIWICMQWTCSRRWLWGRPVWRKHSKLIASWEPLEGRF